jgi:hypothetical protein
MHDVVGALYKTLSFQTNVQRNGHILTAQAYSTICKNGHILTAQAYSTISKNGHILTAQAYSTICTSLKHLKHVDTKVVADFETS